LRTFFAPDKLDIVDQKQVHLPVLVAILFGVLLANGADEVICELFGRTVKNLHSLPGHGMADRVEKMCLPQTDTSIDKEGVEAMTGLLHDGLGRGVGQAVVVSDYK